MKRCDMLIDVQLPLCTAWYGPPGLDRAVIPRLPLAVRTRNAFGASSFLGGDDALTAQHVMRLQNFGRKSLTDLLLGLETFLKQRIRDPAPSEHIPDGLAVSPPIEELRRAEWERAGEVLAPLLAAAIELYGARSLTAAPAPQLRRACVEAGDCFRCRRRRAPRVGW